MQKVINEIAAELDRCIGKSRYFRIDGSTPAKERQESVELFQKPDSKIQVCVQDPMFIEFLTLIASILGMFL